MAASDRPPVTKIASLALFVAFAALGLWVQGRLPFWSSWDMDLITAVDLFRMESGLLPQHINHTGFGMYLPLRTVWDWLPLEAHNLTDWLAQPVPLFPLAETITWLRALSLLAMSVLVMAVWSALPRLSVALLLVTLPSLWLFPMLHVRTELWAVMWYGLAFAVLPWARSPRGIVLSFFLAGLGFLTKYQGLFLHAGLVLIVFHQAPAVAWPRLPGKRTGAIVLVTFLFLGLCAALSYVPNHFATFSRATAPNFFFFAGLILLTLPFWRAPWARLGGPLWWAVAALMAVFPLHFLMGLAPGAAWEYLVFDWRMLFLRLSKGAIAAARTENIFLWSLQHHAGLLLVWALLAGRHWRRGGKRERIFVAAYALLILLSLKLATRGHIQDALWNDFLLLFGLLPFLPGLPRRWDWALVPLVAIQLYQIRHIAEEPHIAEDQLDRYWLEPYESPDVGYTEAMARLLPWRDLINREARTLPAR